MGILGNIAKRDIRGDTRKEDSALLYFNPEDTMGMATIVEYGEYRGIKWNLGTCGEYPYVSILHQTVPSTFAGMDFVRLPDRNGKELKVNRICVTHPGINGTWTGGQMETRFIYSYCNKGDYKFSGYGGHKYTVRELKEDIESFIDSIIEKEDEFIKSK